MEETEYKYVDANQTITFTTENEVKLFAVITQINVGSQTNDTSLYLADANNNFIISGGYDRGSGNLHNNITLVDKHTITIKGGSYGLRYCKCWIFY